MTDDSMAAPAESWSITFDVDSNPVAGNPDALGFDAPFSNFTYMLNGSGVAVSPAEIRFYTTTGGGLFTLFFGPETGFNNGIPIPEFTFSGSQAFSGATASPTILAGSNPISDVLYSDSLNYDDEGASGSVAILSGPTTTSTPEPSTFRLFLAAVAAAFLVVRRGTQKAEARSIHVRVLGPSPKLLKGPAFCVIVAMAFVLFAATGANGQRYTVLHSFCSEGGGSCADANPTAGLIQDAAGNLYGTTNGTVFELNNAGQETVLYSFCSQANCTDGESPNGGLILDPLGNLYGTTEVGGSNSSGTVFRLAPPVPPSTTWTETVLYNFCSAANCADGSSPLAGLIQDAAGNLYGTTSGAATSSGGTVFKLDNIGRYTILYSFCSAANCTDGSGPLAGLIRDAAGNLYGTTNSGGANGSGTVFKVDRAGHETVLHSFCSEVNCADGSDPLAGLIQDAAGNLYGTTWDGGNGGGTVFQLAPPVPPSTTWTETVLYSFCSAAKCTDGNGPQAGLIQDAARNLYGTTFYGGAQGACPPAFGTGCGTVFKIDTTGQETVLYSFCSEANCTDGYWPLAGLIEDAAGNLYGTTPKGGVGDSVAFTNGVVFELATRAPGKTLGDCNCDTPGEPTVGQPITVSTGNMFEQATDYTTAGQNPLGFTRYYNSQQNTAPVASFATSLGVNWRSTFDRYLNIASANSVTAERSDGHQLTFTLNGGTWTPDTDVDVTLTNAGATWTLTDHDDTVETYTAVSASEAQLQTIKARNGYTQTLAHNGSHEFTSVTDSYGRTLSFTYNGSGLLENLTTPDGTTVTYGYAAAGGSNVLTSATYSTTTATTITYEYKNAAVPFALTGIIDQDGNDYATWTYDGSSRALSSQLGVGANLTTVVYNGDGSRTVTNALGVQDTYKFTTLQGVPKVTEIDRAATATTAAATELFTYDANGYTVSQTDWNGNRTSYVNDSHGQPLTIKEAVGTAVARTTTISYDPTWVHLPKQIVTPGLTARFTYDGSGELLTKTLTDTTTTAVPYATNGQTRTTTNTWANFLLASSKSPNLNPTSFTYDGSGALIKITNALNQPTNITAHTGGGLPETIVDPNGVTTTLTYDARQRLLTSTVATSLGPRTTTLTYDAAGNLTKTTLPDGSALTNAYDAAHRLTTITDLFHQNVDYTLDPLGDHTKTNLTAVGNRIQRQHSDSFDFLGRTLTDTGGVGQVTAYSYDPNGNALTITDPLGRVTSQIFDALNRLSKVTDPAGGITATTYDTHDRILSVTDPNGNATTYVYDGFGDLIQQLSPDSGKTVYHYDADGNLTGKTDAAGKVTNNTYDALDRILTTSYPADATLNIAYTYDQAGHGFGIGRLTSLTDAAGSLSRSYDERGNLLSDARMNGATTLKTVYTYDAASRIASITYPSGWTVSQTRDIMGRIWQLPITAPGGASAGNAITNATYEPYGPLYTLTYGNGVNEARHFDLDYRVTSLTDTGAHALQNLTYSYDANNNVSSIADAVTPANSQVLGYDVLNRLTSASGAYGALGYNYDLVGNRLKQTLGAAATTYSYSPGTNHLASITAGGVATPVTYIATGNISSIPPTTGAPLATLAYNADNRLASVTGTAVAITGMTYDAFGQRLSKASGGTVNYFTYSQDGSLLEEDDAGFPIDYVYLNGRPVAEILPSSGKVYFLHDDRLGTPQLVTDSGQNPVWSTTYQPFGQTAIPVASIAQNLRFPGQYVDAEAGWNHNGFRDYVPSLGRYAEADLIGLRGSINPYLYVSANPVKLMDRLGLCDCPNPSINWKGVAIGSGKVIYGAANFALGVTAIIVGDAGAATIPVVGWTLPFTVQQIARLRIASGLYTSNAGMQQAVGAFFYCPPEENLNTGTGGSDPVDPSNPLWIPLGGDLYYYDEPAALGAPQ